ncbi:hypothetical protein UCRPA7_2472 [Phaeoacremonium minimum UCRPA7]|uniref:Uncharacterized protein n=1 Tax=Phaeoacremonium minimum (strain UCR-PA7) TaxID=1286976 RepID=R8BRT4_PHAM7|nr:hypothetical protein UCRPA7_2472 [Phaeoacremonium minimum UCRPA7]EOO01995.1 hypothetical protein UCRPA7_2472 [Phaeoacremonium minimum UCRPA7]
MASPDVAVPQVNGLSASPHPGSPQSINSSTKRKRDVSDDGSAAEENVTDEAKPAVNGNHLHRDQKTLIRNYLEVVKRYDVNPSILKRPIPEPANAEEPEAKRQKSDDGTKPLSIEDKVLQDEYEVLDDVFLDIRAVVKDRIAELQSSSSNESVKDSDAAIVDTNKFRDKAHELYRRESAYPKSIVEPSLSASGDVGDALHPSSTGSVVLTVYGNAPQPKHLFSSLQKRTATPDHPEGVTRPLPPVALPNGITTTVVVPSDSLPKGGRTLTLGELFPAPRNLPPLQPPKAPKSTTKSNILGFYHPELMVKPKYRSDTYYSQNISTGHWLDYSNATPSSQNKTKQRERAQSLAGHKPSSDELEMSEMEALFRGAFSSFAPSKDDSAAIVPSGQLGRMWWQRFGQRSFQRMIELETPESELEEPKDADAVTPLPIDEDLIQNAIEEWDPSVVDPGLEEVMGKKTAHESDVDELLQEVSDLIETLSSYQRNRNLTLPTSQNRYSADPVNGDMLANGTLAQQPSEEEIATYDILKAQLALIIKQLPPYAVARLNSDKLEDLNHNAQEASRVLDNTRINLVVNTRCTAIVPSLCLSSIIRRLQPVLRLGTTFNGLSQERCLELSLNHGLQCLRVTDLRMDIQQPPMRSSLGSHRHRTATICRNTKLHKANSALLNTPDTVVRQLLALLVNDTRPDIQVTPRNKLHKVCRHSASQDIRNMLTAPCLLAQCLRKLAPSIPRHMANLRNHIHSSIEHHRLALRVNREVLRIPEDDIHLIHLKEAHRARRYRVITPLCLMLSINVLLRMPDYKLKLISKPHSRKHKRKHRP